MLPSIEHIMRQICLMYQRIYKGSQVPYSSAVPAQHLPRA